MTLGAPFYFIAGALLSLIICGFIVATIFGYLDARDRRS